ncbi:hypothetical protein [Bradyrhizobium elkanii]|uniref:hypothetical protein n=1 Tax=Bradyrhizobium elkanii TaxID=29448 RepID=UPI003D204091
MRMNAFGRAAAALGVGIVAVGHWFWVYQGQGATPHARLLAMNHAVELYAGIFLIGVGVHALSHPGTGSANQIRRRAPRLGSRNSVRLRGEGEMSPIEVLSWCRTLAARNQDACNPLQNFNPFSPEGRFDAIAF